MRDDSDFRAQGWVNGPTARPCAFVPSFTGLGESLALLGANRNGTSGTPGVAGVTDPGYFNTGVTVNSLWNSGGFTFGCSAKLNGGVRNSVAGGFQNQICFDGTKYWANIRNVQPGATNNIATSTDLVNWTNTPAQPTGVSTISSVSFMGNGIIAVIGSTGATANTVFWTNNNGATWTTLNVVGLVSVSNLTGVGMATGNSAFPHVLYFANSSTTSSDFTKNALYVGDLTTGTFVSVKNSAIAGINSGGRFGITNGFIHIINNGFVYAAQANNVALNTAGAWTNTTVAVGGSANDLVFFPAGNLWLAATSTGIFSTPNPGTAIAPIPPSGAAVWTQRWNTGLAATRLAVEGNIAYATNNSSSIVSSTDGLVWTTTTPQHLVPATVGQAILNHFNDGTQWVYATDTNLGAVFTSTTMTTNFQMKTVSEFPEANAGNLSVLGLWGCSSAFGSTFSSPIAPSFGISVSAASAGNRTVTLYAYTTGGVAQSVVTGTIPATSPTSHFFEIKGVKESTSTNAFRVTLIIDGVTIGTSATFFLWGASVSDTTTQAIITLPASGNMTQFDNMYLTIDDGQGNVGPLGVITILPMLPATDAQAQWTKNGGAASNALSVRAAALSTANPANNVTANVDGAKDEYNVDALPAGYKVAAIIAEGYFAKVGAGSPTVNVGVLSGASETDSTNTTIGSTNYTYINKIVEKDPNGNVSWTTSAANAAKLTITKVS